MTVLRTTFTPSPVIFDGSAIDPTTTSECHVLFEWF